jgi:hypothetical protein
VATDDKTGFCLDASACVVDHATPDLCYPPAGFAANVLVMVIAQFVMRSAVAQVQPVDDAGLLKGRRRSEY